MFLTQLPTQEESLDLILFSTASLNYPMKETIGNCLVFIKSRKQRPHLVIISNVYFCPVPLHFIALLG